MTRPPCVARASRRSTRAESRSAHWRSSSTSSSGRASGERVAQADDGVGAQAGVGLRRRWRERPQLGHEPRERRQLGTEDGRELARAAVVVRETPAQRLGERQARRDAVGLGASVQHLVAGGVRVRRDVGGEARLADAARAGHGVTCGGPAARERRGASRASASA